MKRIILTFVAFALVAIVVLPVLPAEAAGLVPACGGNDNPCQFCHLVMLIQNVVNWLVGVLFIIASIIFAIAGIRLVMSRGNQSEKQWAKERFIDVIIGLIIIMAAWILIDTVLKALVRSEVYGMWNVINCAPQPGVFAGPVSNNTGGGGQGAGGTSGIGGQPTRFATGACSPEALQSVWGANAATMSCIIRGESGCNPGTLSTTDRLRDGTSFSVGLYQVNLTVHNLNHPECQALNGGQPLNCIQAFQGRNYAATVVDRNRYATCVSAAQNAACNTAVARSLLQTPRGFSHWGAYTDPRNGCR